MHTFFTSKAKGDSLVGLTLLVRSPEEQAKKIFSRKAVLKKKQKRTHSVQLSYLFYFFQKLNTLFCYFPMYWYYYLFSYFTTPQHTRTSTTTYYTYYVSQFQYTPPPTTTLQRNKNLDFCWIFFGGVCSHLVINSYITHAKEEKAQTRFFIQCFMFRFFYVYFLHLIFLLSFFTLEFREPEE